MSTSNFWELSGKKQTAVELHPLKGAIKFFLSNNNIVSFDFKSANTVKPVYNDHLGDKVSAVVIDRSSIWRRPVYNGQKSVNNDIWSLFKGSITFHLVTRDTEKNKSACIFVQNKKQCCDKTTYYK